MNTWLVSLYSGLILIHDKHLSFPDRQDIVVEAASCEEACRMGVEQTSKSILGCSLFVGLKKD